MGKNTRPDICLDPPKPGFSNISRVHASLYDLGDGSFKIVDGLDGNYSRNGIIVNNFKIKDHILKDGDTIVFGGAALDKVEHGQPVSNWPLAVTYTFKEVKNIPIATSIVSGSTGSSRIDTTSMVSSYNIPAAHRVYTPTVSYNNPSGTKTHSLPYPIEKIISIL